MDPTAFDLCAGAENAALCLHGLTGTPYEVRPLGEELARRGIRAYGPVLPGHGTTPEDLASVPHRAWVEAARSALLDLRKTHTRVFALGLSMGGLLTLLLAATEKVDAAVAVGTPLRLRAPLAPLIPLLKYLRPIIPKSVGSDIRDPAARARHPSYPAMPLAAVHELTRLQRRVRGLLPRLEAPLLVAHGVHDGTANPADAKEILEAVASEERELLLLEASAHVVPVDCDGGALARAAADFLGRFV